MPCRWFLLVAVARVRPRKTDRTEKQKAKLAATASTGANAPRQDKRKEAQKRKARCIFDLRGAPNRSTVEVRSALKHRPLLAILLLSLLAAVRECALFIFPSE